MKRLPKPHSQETPDPSEGLDQDIERLAQRLGGPAALMDYLCQAEEAHAAEPSQAPKAAGPHLIIRLSAEDLRRLDEESAATHFTRARWVVALIQKTLYGKPQFNRSDRMELSKIAKTLQQIEVRLTKSARSIEEQLANARILAQRLSELDHLRDQVRGMAGALNEAFRGNDVYWQALTQEEPTPEAKPAASNIHVYAKRKSSGLSP